MRSSSDLLVENLTAILGLRSHVRRRKNQVSISRSTNSVEPNTYGLPEGEPIIKELKRWFRRQKKAVMEAIPKSGPLPMHLPMLASREWVDPMAAAMVPLLARYWNESYQEGKTRLSRERSIVVVNPHLRAQIEKQSFNFCQATNQTTSEKLEVALDKLKHEFVQGLVKKGETLLELTQRVRSVFTELTESRAARIAITETSRAVHSAQILAAQESGVVAGFEWLISVDACPLCQMIATEVKQVRIGQRFAVIGNHPEYSNIEAPPAHVNCRCSLIEVLLPEYGGPTDVEWGLTIFHPEDWLKGEEYEPPRGLKVAEPEPERIKVKPKPRLKHQPKLLPPLVEHFPTKQEIEQNLGVSFIPSPGAKRQRYATVVVSVSKLEAELAKDIEFHVGPGGVGPSAKPGAYERFQEFLLKAKLSGEPIEMPRVEFDVSDQVFISDGRHRWAVLRDQGAQFLPITVPRKQAKKFKTRFGE